MSNTSEIILNYTPFLPQGEDMNLDELKKLDVTVSMKGTADAILAAMDWLSDGVKNGNECSLQDTEILAVINTKLLEVEEEFYRPLDAPDIFEKLMGIAQAAKMMDLREYCQGQMDMLRANELHFEGYTQLYYGNCVKAAELLGKAYNVAPEHPVAKIDLDKAQKRLDKAPAELKKAEAAIEKKPEKADGYLKKANALVTMGKLEEAMPFFDKAISLAPESDAALAKKGAALEGLGRFDEAIPIFHKVLEIKPNSQIAKKGLNLSEYFTGKR